MFKLDADFASTLAFLRSEQRALTDRIEAMWKSSQKAFDCVDPSNGRQLEAFKRKWNLCKCEMDKLYKERDEIGDQLDALHAREHEELRQQIAEIRAWIATRMENENWAGGGNS
jgi:uncharacterized coiled-coil DUF342 family protein